MKTAICYYSEHHGNTKLLLDAIQDQDPDVVLIDCTKKHEVDLLGYDRIGFASGIYYGSFAKPLLSFAQINLPDKKQVFFIFTCGSMAPTYTKRSGRSQKQRKQRSSGNTAASDSILSARSRL